MKDMKRPPIKLIYILGLGHSGTTLLDLVLDSHSQIVSAGEVYQFQYFFYPECSPKEIQKKNQLKQRQFVCTCGVNVNECGFWSRVKEELSNNYGIWQVDPRSDKQDKFVSENYVLMEAILKVSGKTFFCDNSKSLERLEKLLKSDWFDISIIHLIRDGRGVAFSHTKKGEKIGFANSQRYNYYQVLKTWNNQNISIRKKYENNDNYILIRYEDFVDNPQACLVQILNKIGLSLDDNQININQFEHHQFAGNRETMSQSRDKKQTISRDLSYVKNLTFKEWWLGTILACPALKTFNYPMTRNHAKLNK